MERPPRGGRLMFRSASFSVFVLAAACATTGTNRPQLGTVHLRPYTAPGASPAVFSVQQGRILSPDLDVVADPDGCLRGHAGNSPVELCPRRGRPLRKSRATRSSNGRGLRATSPSR